MKYLYTYQTYQNFNIYINIYIINAYQSGMATTLCALYQAPDWVRVGTDGTCGYGWPMAKKRHARAILTPRMLRAAQVDNYATHAPRGSPRPRKWPNR